MSSQLFLVKSGHEEFRWAAVGAFNATFYLVQAAELLAGESTITLMGFDIRDGMRMSGRLRRSTPIQPSLLRPRA
jgi:hypothetical protein